MKRAEPGRFAAFSVRSSETEKRKMAEKNTLYEHAEAIIRKTIEDVLPDRAVRNALEGLELQGRVFVLAVGKAARVMAEAAADVLGARMENGLVVTKYGHAKGALPGFLVMEAGHPVPDENSVRAGEAAVRFVREAGEGDTVLFLISGGGSALLELPEEAGPEVRADKDRIGQVLSVLLDNALAYTPSPGRVLLGLEAGKRNIWFFVSDTGPGVPEGERKEIFHRFHRGRRDRTDRSHFGLGLSIAAQIVNLHGGKIWVQDGRLGGAEFVLELPR